MADIHQLLLAFFAASVLSGGAASAAEQPQACQEPDSSLLKSRGAYSGRAQLPDGGKIELYNAQARRFNDCTRQLIDGNNDAMDRVRDEANAKIRVITETANKQTGAVDQKARAAFNGVAPPAGTVPTDTFPNPDCRKPDGSLLTSKKGGGSSVARGELYVRQDQAYQSCVRDYVQRASAEGKRIAASANAEIRRVADEANIRIDGLRDVVRNGIETSNSAALAKSQMVEGTPLAATDGLLQARSAANPIENSQADPDLWPVRQNTPTGEGVARAITCRAPQRLVDSHRLGPKICKRNGVWAALYRAGKDLSPDGKTVTRFDVAQKTHPDLLQQNQ